MPLVDINCSNMKNFAILLAIAVSSLAGGCQNTLRHGASLAAHQFYSASIEESKATGLFVAEMIPIHNPVVIEGDTARMYIERAWVEHGAFYDENWENIIVVPESYIYAVLLKDEPPYGFAACSWTIGVTANRYMRSGARRLLISGSITPPNDEEVWLIKKGPSLQPLEQQDNIIILGKMDFKVICNQ